MYAPFEWNDLMGPSMALGAFATAIVVAIALSAYREHLAKEEKSFRHKE